MAKKTNDRPMKEKLQLEVVDETARFYIVEHEGKRYNVWKYDFQRRPGTSRPLRLQCIKKSEPNGRIIFTQDLAPIFAERYKVNQIYDFTVDADMTGATNPHYKVSDGSGYWVPLPASPDITLRKGDNVKLRVTRINGIFLGLTLVRDYLPSVTEMPVLADFVARFGHPFLKLVTMLRRSNALAQTIPLYDADDKSWLITAAHETRDAIFSLDSHMIPRKELQEAVTVFRDSLTFLLEDSGFLRADSNINRNAVQDDLARTIARADDLITALTLVQNRSHEAFVKQTFEKIRRSGYLYRPESKLRTLMYIFSLRSELIDRKMDELIEIIQQGDANSWKAEPFRSAFVEQLQLYIESNHVQFDTVSDAEADAETADRLDRMIRALAIQQLLEEDNDATPLADTVINRSRLYRYFAFMKHAERDLMLEKAFNVLLRDEIDAGEYTLSDTRSVQGLKSHLLHAPDPVAEVLRYENSGVTMCVRDSRIEFRADDSSGRAVLQDLNLWHGLQVYLPEQLPASLRKPHSISDYKNVWNEIERSMFTERHRNPVEEITIRPRTRLPEINETVDIVIDRVSDIDPLVYECHVAEIGFHGYGTLHIREVAGSDRPVHISAFLDDNGNPLAFTARVTGCSDNGLLTFSLSDGIRAFVRDSIRIDDEVAAVIINIPSHRNGNTFTALTEHGYIVSIRPDETTAELQLGSQIIARICGTTENGRIIQAEHAGDSDGLVEYESSVETLLYSYGHDLSPELAAAESTANEEDESENDLPLSDAAAKEIMHIIARRADMETDLVRSYNHFAAARLLARMISDKPDDPMRQHYDQRCRVLEILDDFATNGRIDLERLSRFNDQIMRGTATNPYAEKLRILAAMERPDYTETVWSIIQNSKSDEIIQLGRLVIAYNAIDGFKLGEEQRKIREHIYTLLNLDIERQPEQIAGGLESQTVEFKTSAVYPAGGVMRVDVARQMTELVQVICGFLNSTGGCLYIGVSDQGYVRGLANDLEHFGSIDRMTLELHNAIHNQLGFIASYASYINITPEQHGDKTIIAVNIKPLPKPVTANGVYYERQNTSTEYVPKDKEAEFIARHSKTPYHPAASVPEPEQEKAAEPEIRPTTTQPAPQSAPQPKKIADSEAIATSRLRRNFIHYDGSSDFSQPDTYLFVNPDASYTISHEELWTDEDAAVALGLTEDEAAGSVVVVFASGHVARIRIDSLNRSRRRKLSTREKIVFLSPVSDTDGLIVFFKDERGVYFKQFFAPDAIAESQPSGQGERIVAGTPVFCETVCEECHSNFGGIQRNGQRIGRTDDELRADIDDCYRRLG